MKTLSDSVQLKVFDFVKSLLLTFLPQIMVYYMPNIVVDSTMQRKIKLTSALKLLTVCW